MIIWNLFLLCFIRLLIVSNCEIYPDEPPKVCNGSKCLTGMYMPGFQVDYFEAFMGIPFAAPPVGKLRFKVFTRKNYQFFTYNMEFISLNM